MASLPAPSEFEAVIIYESDTLCVGFVKLMKFSYLLYKFMNWLYASPSSVDELSQAFKAKVCNVVCSPTVTV